MLAERRPRSSATRIKAQVGDDPDINVRGFECLGACDIAPMASVDGVYVGPIELDEVPELVDQLRAGEPVLPAKQLARRASVDPNAGIPGPPTIAGRDARRPARTERAARASP